jgi:hypothetical protein
VTQGDSEGLRKNDKKGLEFEGKCRMNVGLCILVAFVSDAVERGTFDAYTKSFGYVGRTFFFAVMCEA